MGSLQPATPPPFMEYSLAFAGGSLGGCLHCLKLWLLQASLQVVTHLVAISPWVG